MSKVLWGWGGEWIDRSPTRQQGTRGGLFHATSEKKEGRTEHIQQGLDEKAQNGNYADTCTPHSELKEHIRKTDENLPGRKNNPKKRTVSPRGSHCVIQ